MIDHDDNPTRYRAIGEVLQGAAERAANQLVVGAAIVACIAVPVSVSRTISFGWNPVYGIHIAGLIAMLLLCWHRHRLAVSIKLGVVLIISISVSVSALFNTGIYGNGPIWGAFSVFVASMYLQRNAIVAVAAFFLGLYVLSGIGFMNGWLTLPADPIEYLRSPTVWGSAIIGSFFFVVLIIIVYTTQKSMTQQLILELENKTKQLAMMADHDSLTGLPNLRFIRSRTEALLEELKERGGESALFFIDLDGFKSVNDAHGHDAGDHVLKNIATALLGIVRSGDVVARVGGDEFVILVNGNASLPLPDLEDFARRILAAVQTETRYDNRSLVVGASVGLTRLANESDSYDAAVMRADKAMYRVKSEGKNGFATA